MKTSTYKGVSFVKVSSKSLDCAKGKWRAQIRVHGVNNHIGYFDTPREAAVAYDKIALRFNKPTNILRPLNG